MVTAGTLVHARDGLKPIESIAAGEFSDEYWDELSKPIGWRRAILLESHQLVQLANGATMRASMVERIWRTRTAGEGWIEVNPDSNTGHRVLVKDGRATGDPGADVTPDFAGVDDFDERNSWPELQDKWAYPCHVYNLEVEDFHTYYIGEQGVWVHNNHCSVNSP